MTQQSDSPSPPVWQTWRLAGLLAIRVALTLSLLLTAYYLLPTKGSGGGSDVPWLSLQLCSFAGIVGLMVPAIIKAKHPIARGIEALALIIPLYLLIFSRIYLSYSLSDPSAFTEPLDKTAALYFTVTVFATVGFGDIVAQTNSMRLLVTLQMLGNLALLGAVVRLVVTAAQRGLARKHDQAGFGNPEAPGP